MMENKKLYEIATVNDANGRTHGEHLWIIAPNSESAIKKALRFAGKRYGCKQRLARLEQHGTIDVL